MPTATQYAEAALRYRKVPYVWGGKTAKGLDCSGLVTLAGSDVGAPQVEGSSAQIASTRRIPLDVARRTPGALLWRAGHDSISLGNGRVVEAITPAVAESNFTATYDGGKPRWTDAGLLPGIDYPEEAQMAAKIPSLLIPIVGGYVTSGFDPKRVLVINGKRIQSPHGGIDIGCNSKTGVAVRSPIPGRVTRVVSGRKNNQGAGSGTVLAVGRSGNGVLIEGSGVTVLLGHVTPKVKVGDIVERGAVVGYTDDSGIQSAPHVHMEVWARAGSVSSAFDFRASLDFGTPAMTPPPTSGTTPPPPSEEDEMTPDEKKQLAETHAVVGQLRTLLMVEGQSFGYPAHAKNQLDALARAVASIAGGNIAFPGSPGNAWNAFVTVVNVIRERDGQTPLSAEVDEAELAQALAPLIAEHIRTLDQATLAQFATAATDEVARRLSQK